MALITPLRDGMNLVAKEFVACQDDDDPGVLILSPFAGAGGIMQEALQVSGHSESAAIGLFPHLLSALSQVNPYETDNVADVLDRALEMSIDERRLRMNQVTKQIEVSFSCLNTEQ